MNVRLRVILGLCWSAACFGAEQAVQKQVFLFDMHNVLFDMNKVEAASAVLKSLPWLVKPFISQVYQHPLKWRAWVATLACYAVAQKPRAETWKAVEQLAQRHPGALYIFSNVSPQELALLKGKYPDFFALFSGIFHSSAEINWVSKTDPVICNQVQTVIARDHGNARVTLFDDKASNQACAERNKWQFFHVKSDKQLADALRNESWNL